MGRSLYERLGGKNAINAVVDDFVARCAADERINGKFARTDIARLKASLIDRAAARGSRRLTLVDDRPPGGASEGKMAATSETIERLYYGYSLFTCLPAAMTERPTAGTGTVMRPETFRRYATDAGFRGFEPLEEPSLDMLRFYRLTP